MAGEIDAEAAAIAYGQMLKQNFGDDGLDMILLGMGPDGHTASLFPNTKALGEIHHRCVANYVEKLDTWRITLSAPFINRAKDILILVAGADKCSVCRKCWKGHGSRSGCRFSLLTPPLAGLRG